MRTQHIDIGEKIGQNTRFDKWRCLSFRLLRNFVRGAGSPRTANLFTGIGGLYFLEVTVYQNQVEKALKVLKRQMTKEGLLKELKRRRFYEKPSVKKKRKQKEAKKKRKAAMRRSSSW